jgi:hypothetical protein
MCTHFTPCEIVRIFDGLHTFLEGLAHKKLTVKVEIYIEKSFLDELVI